MRRFLLLLSVVLFLASCGTDSHHFRIEGHLLQMNQGEFYIYSDDGTIDGLDTIKVQGGRFALEIPCDHPATLTMVFPNFSEQPIFAEPGKTVEISGDASHLKMMKVKGSDDNELMSSFREQISNASPPEIKRYATQFIEDHPESPVGVWLLKKYFITTATPDYKTASRLAKVMLEKQQKNNVLVRMSQSVTALQNCGVGNRLPDFTAYDINGKLVSSSNLAVGTAVICTFASWSYNSSDMLRQLQTAVNEDGSLKVAAFSLDASVNDVRNTIKMNQLSFPVVCTGELFDTKPLRKLGMLTVPDNIVLKNGRIVARDLSTEDLMKQLGR